MNCRTAIDRALARRDAPLPASHETELQEHLSRCESCALEARQLDTALTWAAELPVAEPSESFDWRLRLRLSKLEREADGVTAAPWRLQARWPLQFAGSAAAAAALVLTLGWYLGNSRSKLPTPSTSAPEVRVGTQKSQFRPLLVQNPARGVTPVSQGGVPYGPPLPGSAPLVPTVQADSGRGERGSEPAPPR